MKANLKAIAPAPTASFRSRGAAHARARAHHEGRGHSELSRADRKAIVELLNTALATEIVCVLRYKRHYFVTHGIRAKFVAAEFLEHANEEQAHADQIAERIVQLGEDPDLNPATLLSRSHAEYDEATSLARRCSRPTSSPSASPSRVIAK